MVQLVFRLDGFSYTLIIEDFSKIFWENLAYVKSGNNNEFCSLKHIYIDGDISLNFITVSSSVLLRMRNVSETTRRNTPIVVNIKFY